MIQTGFERRVKVQQIIENQLPEFILSESPKAAEFLKQYYISQEYQSGPSDIAENLDQYLKLDNLTPEVITGETTLYSGISSTTDTVKVYSTKGFPNEYGLFQIDNEIFTYTGITTNTFTGCIRGFSGITTYRTELNPEELVFKDTEQSTHIAGTKVRNLSSEFLKEFYKKLKYTFTPGLEDVDFVSNLDVNNFIKEARSFYEAKGTEESFRILFNVLYGVTPKVVDLEQFLTKPSSSEFLRREVVIAERVSGDPNKLVGQTIRKSTDSATQASVSEVEIFTRSGINTYFKIGLFVGFDDRDLIEGTFRIQPQTKVISPVSVGSSVITVDSTIGFGATGTIISGNNIITYTNKSVNQFFGCSGVTNAIATKDNIRTDEVFYGYEDGNTSKKVEIRITGVLSEFKQINDIKLATEGQKVYTKNVGEKIKNPQVDKTYKQLIANSWIYNTSSRFEVDQISGSSFTLKSEIDRSSLSVGDTVDILLGSTENVAHANATVATINATTKQITLNNLIGFTANPSLDYSIRRKLKTSTSSGTPLAYNNLTSNVQNFYNENDEYVYVASNSLPSYTITKDAVKASIPTSTGDYLQDYNSETTKYSIISFSSSVPFITGDEVIYKPSSTPLNGLTSGGSYYVKVLSPNNKIKLYQSRALIESDSYVEFSSASATGSHTFILYSQKEGLIYPQKLLKKFPLAQNIKNGNNTVTTSGSVGMLVNGVEIINYKSNDKVYYGPVDKVRLYNGGDGYDVINPPNIVISNSLVSGGTTALVRPVVTGIISSVVVDPQDFDLKNVFSVTLSGGNGKGAILEPVLETRYREVEFDSREIAAGGGIDIDSETISFTTNHNFKNGQPIVYNRNGNNAIGIGSYGQSNSNQLNTLSSGSVYYTKVVNNTTIKLYETLNDYNSGINTVGFTSSVTQGIHKFRSYEGKKTLKSIKVINPGSGYTNRKLIVKPENISTVDDSINFENHGFSDGDIIVYSTSGTVASGLSTSIQYSVLKEGNNKFRLANAGVAGTITENYIKRKYVNITSTGTGYQNFSYPDITLTINAEYDGNAGIITATPLIRGKIVDLYLYESGTGYGSTILNFHKKPRIDVQVGKDAELKPLIADGRIISVQVTNSGSEYSTAPDLVVNGDGIGAKLRAIVNNKRVTSVIVVNSGIGYSASTTTVKAEPVGSNAFVEVSVRSLTLNNQYRFGNEILIEGQNGVEYGIVGYSTSIGQSVFGDSGQQHSPIIGWAYDGNPIYGPYSYSNPSDINSSLKFLSSGYVLSTSDVVDRPSAFGAGFFVEDYKFNNSGDLDQYNGRFGITPEFPEGVYAYYAGIKTDIATNTLTANFPYFVGNSYRSLPVTQNLNQDYDFNNSNLIRNTFPYKSSDLYAKNDFISEPYEVLMQSATIDSVTKGSVTGFIINEEGQDYYVGDNAIFDNTDTNGGGLSAYVESVTGKTIVDVNTTVETYQSASIIRDNPEQLSFHITPYHSLLDKDSVAISGVSTFIKDLTDSHIIGVSSEKTYLIQSVASNAVSGFVTDIYVSTVPVNLSIGSTVAIGTERMSVLNVFSQNKVLRVERGLSGTGHTSSTEVTTVTGRFTIPLKTEYFDSKLDDVVYFNPELSVGIGTTTGGSVSRNYPIGEYTNVVSIPTQSIYLPNHPFKTNQEVILKRVYGSQPISVSNTSTSATFNLPIAAGGTSETLYVINKSKDYIGLCTQVGLTTNTDGLYFRGFTSNGDSTDYKYSLESNFTQVTAKVQKIKSTIAVSTDHGLNNGDIIQLFVNSDQSVGVGTSVSVRVKYNSSTDKLLINPIGFGSTSVNTSSSQLEITSHGFKTGDKVFYNASDLIASGLETGSYYVYRIDDNKFNLASTYYDAVSSPPSIVSIASTGGAGQEISPINPQIKVVKDNDLVFNLSDSSLSGYKFKLYYDEQFNNEIVSTGTTSLFSVSGVGTVGVSTTASLTLRYTNDLPSKLYYTLEKSGFIGTSDTDVKYNSEILFTDSVYDGTYSISGIGTTTFQISLNATPESLKYNQNTTSVLEYTTQSPSAKGGVGSLRITSSGSNYKKLPKFVSIASTDGINADIIPVSTGVGRINEVIINDPGFDFSADKTLSPEVYVSPNITIINRNTITKIDVLYGGSGFITPPDLVVVNPETGDSYDTGLLNASIQGSSISSVEIAQAPKGLSEIKNKIYTTNNSNGVGINSCISSPAGIITCVLSTPILGFTTDAFLVGDKVFVEGIQKLGTTGTGFNSKDYDYNFFEVTAYRNTNPAEVEFSIAQYATNAGIAVTNQNSFATIVREANYPVFDVIQTPLSFNINEKLYIKDGNTYTKIDLIVTENLNDLIKVYGTYELKDGDVIVGKDSGTVATVKSIEENRAFFKIDYSLRRDYGWATETGKLNEDYQVLPDNDYYQNLSYTIKSPIQYEDLINPVNRLLHTSGLKNFADTGITSTTSVSAASTSSTSVALVDIVTENRVDVINNFDFGIDVDVTSDKSKFIKLKNKKLSDYVKCITNRVLSIDNINLDFSNSETSDLYKDLVDYSIVDGYQRFLVQVNGYNGQVQVTEIITLPSIFGDIITFEKGSLYNSENKVGEISGNISDTEGLSLRFIPTDPYNYDYDIKVLRDNFSSSLAGIGTQSIGFVNLTGSNVSVSVGSSANIISASTSSTKALFANVEVINTLSNTRTYVELYVDHNNTDTFISEYYFDNDTSSEYSDNFIGTFRSNISSGVLSLSFENTNTGIGSTTILVRSKIVGFGTTSIGIGTYRFRASGQPEGDEKSARLQTNYSNASGIVTIFSANKEDVTTLKSIAKVGYGNTSALHQILVMHDNTDVYTLQYPFLSIGSTSGIGTFGSEYNGSNLILKFYPDSGISTNISVQVYSEVIQTKLDTLNIPQELTYGSATESLSYSLYNSINGNRVNRTEFDLNHSQIPIFAKTFNPSNSNVLNLTTGTFTIPNHFFNTGERLVYEPGSTFTSIAGTSIQVGSSGLSTEVYAIRLNSDQFQLASSKSNAEAGTKLTFSSYGGGNAHTLEMYKKMEKSIISIDGVVQSPIAYTPISYTLSNNGGQIAAGSTYFSISGISSIVPGDILKIDNEFVKVESVGLGTTSVGPITGTGTFNVIQSTRGFVGTQSTSHTDGTVARIYLGAFNIVKSKIHFTDAPLGNNNDLNNSNIPYARSSFGGRVYLRQDYSSNQIYDNISKSFTGIGQTYRLTVQGINTTGIETGSGVLFINDVFQTPSTVNNIGNNYNFIENAGISSVVFSGITSSNGQLILSDYDVNTNQLPRGGIIISLGSTSGLGFAPLVGASVTAVVSGGVITSVGLGTTDIVGSGYRGVVSIGVTDPNHTGTAANITATVGAGGTLTFNVVSGGTGYVNPVIRTPQPSYENLSVTGVSRLGIGATTETGTGLLVTLDVGASSTTGIGSTLFEVTSFKISRPGYGFRVGDVIKPVGLVTDRNLAAPLTNFELTVLDIFTDSFSSWQFGELDFIDSIASMQNGSRTRFPLYYNGQLLSFESNPESQIDLNAVLLIFINGVIQEPGVHYQFEGGTSFVLTSAPTENDNISVFFYRGTRGIDSLQVNVNESLKQGDSVLLNKFNNIESQTERTIFNITSSDKIETNIYGGVGINDAAYRPFNWIKQKVDKYIGGEYVYKTRDSIESLVYPTAKIIGDFKASSTDIFVDDAQFFNYEENESAIVINGVDAIIVNGSDPVAAAITATVSIAGTISGLTIVDGGSGYVGSSVTVFFSAPKSIGVGIGTTARATLTVTNGSLTTPINIVNPGFGYTYTNPPQVLTPTTNISFENIKSIATVQGFSGIVTGITTTTGSGSHPLALRFFLNANSFTGLSNGYPIYVYDTVVGKGITSVNGSNSSKVGVGTTFADNIYIVRNFTSVNPTNARFDADILSTTSVVGLVTTGSTLNPCGRFSWGRLTGFASRTSPISIGVTGLTVDSGLSTFPTIQRRGYGLRDTGALRKDLG